VRGGVYRVVKEAMGGLLAKLSVSALMFDYILTGPTSGVSAGQYIMGLLLQTLHVFTPGVYTFLGLEDDAFRLSLRSFGAVTIACAVTLYFFRQNLLGIHESSGKALKIMIATTIMAVIILGWCLATLAVEGPANPVPWQPDLEKKVEEKTATETDPETGEEVTKVVHEPKMSEALAKVGVKAQEDPLGLLGRILPESVVQELRHPRSWLSFIGLVGLMIGFGHSILAMSGEETLAQVYREVQSPKLPNFKKAAFIVFVYSVLLTAGISFLAVALIPNDVRMGNYSENLIGGLARHVIGPPQAKLALETFVVVVGFLILAGAVNTAIIGSNGVLNRVAEDGVMPDWFLKPHPRYGTTHRVLYLILGLQLAVILLSRGDMVLLGEAYAFGVVWSFVFKALAMVVLRFKDRTPREYKVPLNVHVGDVEVPIGLTLIFLVLLCTALLNLFTKEVATVGGTIFTLVFLTMFVVSERIHERRRKGARHEHLEQFNRQTAGAVTPQGLRLKRRYRKLVAIRSTQNLFMLEKALAETDPETTDQVVMTAKLLTVGDPLPTPAELDSYDQHLMTAVVERAEKAGKSVVPVIVPTNNPLHAVLKTAQDLGAQELVMGTSNKYTAEEQLDQISFYWVSLHEGETGPLTVRLLSRDREVHLDLAGGSRIPKISERRARSVAELRAAGIGVDRVLLAHDGTQAGSDLFQLVLTMLDPQVSLGLVSLTADVREGGILHQDQERAERLGRDLQLERVHGPVGPALVKLAQDEQYDLIVLGVCEAPDGSDPKEWMKHVQKNAHCAVCVVTQPEIPREVER
jgi:amino acid transporter/nucleotide-binding universal stress UspA family protein